MTCPRSGSWLAPETKPEPMYSNSTWLFHPPYSPLWSAPLSDTHSPHKAGLPLFWQHVTELAPALMMTAFVSLATSSVSWGLDWWSFFPCWKSLDNTNTLPVPWNTSKDINPKTYWFGSFRLWFTTARKNSWDLSFEYSPLSRDTATIFFKSIISYDPQDKLIR